MLAAVAREAGHRVHIVDGKRTGTPVEDVARAVAALDPDHVGICATTISITNAGRIAARVKAAACPRAVVTVGGPHVSAVPERTLERFPGFDYGIVGEGERSYFDADRRGSRAGRRSASGRRPRPPRRRAACAPTRARPTSTRRARRLPPPAWDLRAGLPAPLPAERLQLPHDAGREPRHVARLSVLVHVLRPLHVRPARPLPRRRVRRARSAASSPTSACATSSSTTTSSR